MYKMLNGKRQSRSAETIRLIINVNCYNVRSFFLIFNLTIIFITRGHGPSARSVKGSVEDPTMRILFFSVRIILLVIILVHSVIH